MALTWTKIGNLKGPKGDAGDTAAMNRFDAIEAKNATQDTRLTAVEGVAGIAVPFWKASTAYTAGQRVVAPNGDVVSAKASFTSGSSYTAANWNASTQDGRLGTLEADKFKKPNLAVSDDLNTVTTTGVYALVTGNPTDWVGQHYPVNTRGALTVSALAGASVIQTYTTWVTNKPRIYVRALASGTWGAWFEVGPDINDVGVTSLAVTQDFNALLPTRAADYVLLTAATDWVGQHLPANIRGALRAVPMGSGSIQTYSTFEATPRVFVRYYYSSAWGAWAQVGGPAAAIAAASDGPGSGLKLVPLPLTTGNSEGDAAVTGTARMPMKWAAPVFRARVHIRNINPRGSIVRTGAVSFTGLWLGKHNTASEGTFTSTPRKICNSFSTPADGGEWVSPWFAYNNTVNVEDLLSFGYDATGTTVASLQGTTWTNADPAVAGTTAPTMTRGSTPFYVWIEAETYATTPVIASIGDSLSVGVGSSKPRQDSWLSQYCATKGALPVHYGSSGDSMALWQDTAQYKWHAFDGLARPDALIWSMGSNDLFGGTSAAATEALFLAIIEQAKASFSKNLYLTSITPRTSVAPGSMETERRTYNTWLKTLPGGAREVFDFVTPISSDDETITPAYDSDGIHLTTAGYGQQITSIVTPVTTPPVQYA